MMPSVSCVTIKGGCGFVGTRHHLLHIRYVLRRATAKQTTKHYEGKKLLALGTEKIDHVKSLNRAEIDQDARKPINIQCLSSWSVELRGRTG
jgi:hypothetical protein